MSINPYQAPASSLDIQPSAPAPELWNPNIAGILSLFLTPIFGSYIIGKNWAALGQPERQATSRNWLIASVVVMILSLFVQLLAITYLIIWYLAQNKPQAEYLQEKFGGVYPKKSFGKPTLAAIGIFIGAVMLATIVGGLLS